jgi:hypothetical protein
MKLKKFFKNKKATATTVVALLVVTLVGGGGYYLSQKKGKEDNNKNNQSKNQETSQDQQVGDNLKEKENQQQNQAAKQNNSQPQTQAVTPAILSDISIQAMKFGDETISLSLYGPSGNYDVEKCSNFQSQCLSGWTVKVSNQSYAGHGGLPVDTMSVAESKSTYIIYKIIGGKRVSTSKPITVDRAQVIDTKTFVGG